MGRRHLFASTVQLMMMYDKNIKNEIVAKKVFGASVFITNGLLEAVADPDLTLIFKDFRKTIYPGLADAKSIKHSLK